MPAKIRLQRKGKKGQPFYHIVIADGRAPRDGRFIEKIGYYNPLTKPAEIELDFDSALQWLQHGAQPTDTVRAILSYTGVIYKNHLLKGVAKGAMTEEQAEAKFQAWLEGKQAKISAKKNAHDLSLKEAKKEALAHEKKINEAKAQALAKKIAEEKGYVEEPKEGADAPAEDAPAAEEQVLTEEQPQAEEVKEEEKKEEGKPEAEEVKEEEPKEEPKAEEVKEEEEKKEEPTEEEPKA